MSLLRYNWLRKRGYHTTDGTNCADTDFGYYWVELMMSNGKKIKMVTVNSDMKAAEFIALEKLMDTQLESKGGE